MEAETHQLLLKYIFLAKCFLLAMGKGSNVQKKQAARARHEKEASKPQGGGGLAGKASRTGANAPKVVCQICRTEFMASQSDSQLMGHVENKHPNKTFADCFPERAKAKA